MSTATLRLEYVEHNIAHQYGCPATLTRVTFTHCGVKHVAVRFWRADMARDTGRVEIYTVGPDGMEDPLFYADQRPGCRVSQIATAAIDVARDSADAAARFAALEL